MEHYDVEYNLEMGYLEKTIYTAKKQLDAIRKSSEKQQADIIEAKKELKENSKYFAGSLWSMESFHELAAISQYANPVSGRLSILEAEQNKMLALEKMIKTPYFSRIDFKFDDEDEAEKVYIGRIGLMNEANSQMLVYDWRTPLASVFYRFGVGQAYYDAPGGRICGEVSLKRQYEIQNGKLDYFFDADVAIMDEFLRKLLSKNTSSKMKGIVETIQRDQDIIIRDMENDLMMVQGVAGSGKTSVALHRAAYLMYRGLSSQLSAHNILIVSPNTLFERYIENVLPELGEDNAVSVTFDEMLKKMLNNIQFQTRNQLLECIVKNKQGDGDLRKAAVEFKLSTTFKEILERFIYDIPRRWIKFSDVFYDGKCIKSRELIKAELLSNKRKMPLGVCLQHLERSIFENVHKLYSARMKKLKSFVKGYKERVFEIEEFARLISIKESTALAREVHKFTECDVFMLYKQLFSDIGYFKHLAKGMNLPYNIDDIIKSTQEALTSDYIPYEDSVALLFLQLKLKGFQRNSTIKQVVIDEVQDYHPMHFELFNILYPHAKYTLLGDINQTVEKTKDISFFTQIEKILNKEKSILITMDKSFRCTKEILDFSSRLLQKDTDIKGFNRSGDEPKIYSAADDAGIIKLIAEEINNCKKLNYMSIGLLCKTEENSYLIYNRLREQIDIAFIKSNSTTDIEGICILPTYMAKGLEFDAVLLCDVDKGNYYTDDDKKLLYIGCTRALHRLSLFYAGGRSPLI